MENNQYPNLHPAHEHHERKLTIKDKIALFLTERIGSFWFFVFCCVLVSIWSAWNIFAPAHMRFDDSQFNIWQYISSVFQIVTMPLIMVVQQIQLQHAEARSEFSYLAMKRSIGENEIMMKNQEILMKQNEELKQMLLEHIESQNDQSVILPKWLVPKKKSKD